MIKKYGVEEIVHEPRRKLSFAISSSLRVREIE